jgi:O-antigen/teichoic acid export membrane protein
VIGERWRPATTLIAIFGLTAASHQIGFNWTAFYSARGNTRPLATVNTILMVVFIATAIPLTIYHGLDGMGIALALMILVGLAGRAYYLARLFPGFRMLKHMLRAIAPTVPAAACTLLLRLATASPKTLAAWLAELAVYGVVTVAATWVFERELLREMLSYLRGTARAPVLPAAV